MADTYLFGYSEGSNILKINTTQTLTTDFSPNWGGYSQGWWSTDYSADDSNDNYIVGTIGTSQFRDFFTFAIPEGLGTVTSAELILNRFGSDGLPVTYSLFDVSTDTTTLNQNNGVNMAIFNDLGSGVSYGSVYVADTLNDPLVISLNSAALAAIQGAEGGFFSVGGTLSDGMATPEPATVGLFGAGLLAFGLVRRFRKQQ